MSSDLDFDWDTDGHCVLDLDLEQVLGRGSQSLDEKWDKSGNDFCTHFRQSANDDSYYCFRFYPRHHGYIFVSPILPEAFHPSVE